MTSILFRRVPSSTVPFWLAAFGLAFTPVFERPAHAMHPDARAVIVGGTYGLAIGTILGLVTRPLTDTPRTVLMASSVGLYLGMALGVFYAVERDNPTNPLRRTAAIDGLPPTIAQWMASGSDLPGLRPAGLREGNRNAAFTLSVLRF